MGNVVWGRFPQRVAERAAMRFAGTAVLSPTSMGEKPKERSAGRLFRARCVLCFCATLFFIVGWWPLAVFLLFAATRRPK